VRVRRRGFKPRARRARMWVLAVLAMLAAAHPCEAVQMEGIPAPPRWVTRWRPCDEPGAEVPQLSVTNATAG
jgi:hypothetical protein